MIAPKKLLVCSVLAMLPACKTESGAPAPSTTTTTTAAASPAPPTAAAAPAAGTATAAAAAAPAGAAPTSPAAEGAVAAPTVAVAEPTGPVIEAGCSYDAGQLQGNDGTAFRVSCPANCDKGGIYGTGVYTADTSICRAGIHAGAIPVEGGTLTVVLRPGQLAYRGSEQNGIKSRDYGKYSRSFAVATAGVAPAGSAPAGSVSAAAGAPAAGVAAGSAVIEAGCSYDAGQLTGKDGSMFRVACPAGCEKGSIYGTGVYTADTSICRAGIHSGAIPANGGVVTIALEPGRLAYRGSEQNGIKSHDYGKYSRSYAVVTTGSVTTGSVTTGSAPAGAAAPAPAAAAAAPAEAGSGVIEAGCSYDARQLDGKDGTTFRVACPAGCDIQSSTYGTGVYTADSPICKSAIHSGAIPASGGVATIQLEAGRPAYRGSEQNGIKSRDYGKYSRSYAVVKQ
jgi:hypothetical protein